MYICGEAATLNPDSGGYQTTAISDFTFLIKKEMSHAPYRCSHSLLE